MAGDHFIRIDAIEGGAEDGFKSWPNMDVLNLLCRLGVHALGNEE
jgi:hypothetical protein